MAIGLVDACRNDMLNILRDRIDAGAAPGGGAILLYSGVRPAKGAAPAGTKLAECALSSPCAGNASAGVLTLDAVANGVGLADEFATFARVVDSDGAFVMDLSVGITGSGAEVEIGSVEIVVDGVVKCNSATFTAPGGA
tara:strand:+ start:790 stop:1206 length:417 start_codon:yes stop_codon:yes gene_type:complete